ncbi:STAS domain-containing protein [Actinoplanes siamensis]|uniref:STAS domain-containing protein n=1 Tax=Actinoplanes siamensis TaxID=1223317 RepID=A0A919TLS4_9ACTN|nr:STAS domain-containing protein [Actinoplanes siamensis]GIF06922.1 hypothetical protein Asi03nite_44600 [Actinoplanes siamensis]
MTGDDIAQGLTDLGHQLLFRVAGAEGVGPLRLTLAGELDGEEADNLHAGFAELLARHPGRPIRIDAGDLMFLDSSGIRALLICRVRARAAGVRLSITEISKIGFQVLQVSGLLGAFGDPREKAA